MCRNKGGESMSTLTLKYYFLEEKERFEMEQDILAHTSKHEEEILPLDDNEITELHKSLEVTI